MNAETGFANDQEGVNHYINLCKRNGLLPVGCGTSYYNCDKNRFNDEPCIPMPESWDCNMMQAMKSATGWGNSIVASYGDSIMRDKFLYKPGAPPNRNENLQAVCGKLSGIS